MDLVLIDCRDKLCIIRLPFDAAYPAASRDNPDTGGLVDVTAEAILIGIESDLLAVTEQIVFIYDDLPKLAPFVDSNPIHDDTFFD
jgi:homoserine acetyltransferase